MPLHPEDVDARDHIFTAMALRRGWVASPKLGHVYLQESNDANLQEAEWASGGFRLIYFGVNKS